MVKCMTTTPTPAPDFPWDLEEIRTRMAKLPTTIVSDALDACGLTNNTVAGIRPTWNCPSIIGRALTHYSVPASGHKTTVHGGFKTSDLARPGDVIVASNGGDIENNVWGGLVSWAAMAKGAVGAVVDGAARDIAEFEEMGFPVYSKGVVCRTARGRMMTHSINQPIRFGNVQVRPGDLVYADINGICFIPPDRVLEVLEVAEQLQAKEDEIVAELKKGMNGVMASGNYETMLKQ